MQVKIVKMRQLMLIATLFLLQISQSPVLGTTYAVTAFYTKLSCDETPFFVKAVEDANCQDEVCATQSFSSSGSTSGSSTETDRITVVCVAEDYISAMREMFVSSQYLILDTYTDAGCSTFRMAYGYSATGRCDSLDSLSYASKALLHNNGSASVAFYYDKICDPDQFSNGEYADQVTLTSHSCDVNNYKWYSSSDGSSTSSTSASSGGGTTNSGGAASAETTSSSGTAVSTDTNPPSKTLSTGALIAIIAGGVVALLIVVVGVIVCKRRGQRKPSNRMTSTLGTSDLDTLDAALRRQTGVWNDYVITAKRIPRDKVKVKSLISRGAFGEVYHGVYNGHHVAVKMLLPANRGNLEYVTAFLNEAKLTATMDHPNIITFVGVAWDSLSDVCVVLEFMDGGDLRSLLDKYMASKHPVGVDREKATIALHVCHALTYLHTLLPPVIHRDLKSRNVILNQALEAKLTDFGISKERLDQTMTAGVGTSLWMAPEVMLGEKYDMKADIFSLGVMLSELDIHTLPYARAKQQYFESCGRKMADATLLQKITSGDVRVEFSDASTSSLVELGYACVALNPSDRPRAAEVLYRLQTMIKNELS